MRRPRRLPPRRPIAPFGDRAALARFAAAVDVVTCEFENVPAAALRRVAAQAPGAARARSLAIAQDRLREKNFLRSIGIATAASARVADPAALAARGRASSAARRAEDGAPRL